MYSLRTERTAAAPIEQPVRAALRPADARRAALATVLDKAKQLVDDERNRSRLQAQAHVGAPPAPATEAALSKKIKRLNHSLTAERAALAQALTDVNGTLGRMEELQKKLSDKEQLLERLAAKESAPAQPAPARAALLRKRIAAQTAPVAHPEHAAALARLTAEVRAQEGLRDEINDKRNGIKERLRTARSALNAKKQELEKGTAAFERFFSADFTQVFDMNAYAASKRELAAALGVRCLRINPQESDNATIFAQLLEKASIAGTEDDGRPVRRFKDPLPHVQAESISTYAMLELLTYFAGHGEAFKKLTTGAAAEARGLLVAYRSAGEDAPDAAAFRLSLHTRSARVLDDVSVYLDRQLRKLDEQGRRSAGHVRFEGREIPRAKIARYKEQYDAIRLLMQSGATALHESTTDACGHIFGEYTKEKRFVEHALGTMVEEHQRLERIVDLYDQKLKELQETTRASTERIAQAKKEMASLSSPAGAQSDPPPALERLVVSSGATATSDATREATRTRVQAQVATLSASFDRDKATYTAAAARHAEIATRVRQLTDEIANLQQEREHVRQQKAQARARQKINKAAQREDIATVAAGIDRQWNDLRSSPEFRLLISDRAFDLVEKRHLGRSDRQLQERAALIGRASTYLSPGSFLMALAGVQQDAAQRFPELMNAGSREEFDGAVRRHGAVDDMLAAHADTVGNGFQHAVNRFTPYDSNVSCYSLAWENNSVVVSHLYPWGAPA